MKQDAIEVYDMLIDSRNLKRDGSDIISFGRSIGTGIASHLAKNRPVNCLILQSPYTKIKDVAKEKLPCVLRCFVCCIPEKVNFNNEVCLKQIETPVLMIHGKRDEVIDCENSLKLFRYARTTQKKLELVEMMTHNNYSLTQDIIDPIRKFIETVER